MELPALTLFFVATGMVILLPSMTTEAKEVQAIYVFGDSTADVGNNNHLPVDENTRANYPHNGVDYPGGIPTGRFSNGYNAVDYLAMMMGFKESPPAYFSDDEKAKLERGVNFASGGSGILDATGEKKSFSMNMQIMFFEKEVDRLVFAKGEEAAKIFISKSIFIFSVANNDLLGFYENSRSQNSTLTVKFISSLTTQFKHQIERIYNLGARKFTVFGTGMIGCVPSKRRLTPSLTCLEDLNTLTMQFNSALRNVIQNLSSTSVGMTYSYVDAYSIEKDVRANPQNHGFKVLDAACCGNGLLNSKTLCLPNLTFCSNREEYFSWDYFHLSQAACEVTAKYAFGGSSKFTNPINIEKLIQVDAYTLCDLNYVI